MSNFRMPFGKYRGRFLAELPDDYLDWLTTIGLRPLLRDHTAADIRRRSSAPESPRALPVLDTEIAAAIIRSGCRGLARQHHPDVGGDTATMQRLTATAEALRQVIGGGA